MGDALIKAHKLSTSNPKGPRLLLDIDMKPELMNNNVIMMDEYEDHIGIDWVHSKTKLTKEILNILGIDPPSTETIVEKIKNYISINQSLCEEWKKSAENLIQGGK